MGKGGLRWTPEQLANHERSKRDVMNRAPQPVPPTPPAQTSMQRLQALGRKAPGVMNKTESAFAAHLEARKQAGEILWYAFEAVTLKLAHDCRLTVDFFLMRSDGGLEAVDVKGAKAIVQSDAAVKMRVAASMFPWPFFYAFPKPKKDGGGFLIEEVHP